MSKYGQQALLVLVYSPHFRRHMPSTIKNQSIATHIFPTPEGKTDVLKSLMSVDNIIPQNSEKEKKRGDSFSALRRHGKQAQHMRSFHPAASCNLLEQRATTT